jgi:protein tyrosine phosphatase (PTP) superfamily phosphohydrolase (DUF442 family)
MVLEPAPQTTTTAQSRRQRRIKLYKLALGSLLVSVATLTWITRGPLFHGNLAIVEDGRAIRSAQPGLELPETLRQFGIRSILNLRGGSPDDWWYTAEIKSAGQANAQFYDFPMSATKRPSRRELLTLIDLLESCQYPLLIHCKSGADRTGLASALYLMQERGESPEVAERAFSIQFGHIPLGGTEHLHEPFDEYAAWLAHHKLEHTPHRFRDWVSHEYRSWDEPGDPSPLKPGPRVRRS